MSNDLTKALLDIARAGMAPSSPKIVTEFWMKPIPIREFDWSAVTDNYDGADPPDPIGYGRTEAEAITDLLEQLEP